VEKIVERIKFKTFREFWDKVSPLGEMSHCLSGFIYRGEESNEFELLPRTLRNKQEGIYEQKKVAEEIDMLWNFCYEANSQGLHIPDTRLIKDPRPLLKMEGKKIFWLSDKFEEISALAQHYGIPTRLLDWTSDLFTAFYFASIGAIKLMKKSIDDPKLSFLDKYFVIYALNYRLIDQRIRNDWDRFTSTPEPMPIKFIVPSYSSNQNIVAQSGILSYSEISFDHGGETKVDYTPLDIKLQNIVDNNKGFYRLPDSEILLFKFELPIKEALNMFDFISYFNYSYAHLFPGYAGIVKAMDERSLVNFVNKWCKENL
jgi:hypothetical protein